MASLNLMEYLDRSRTWCLRQAPARLRPDLERALSGLEQAIAADAASQSRLRQHHQTLNRLVEMVRAGQRGNWKLLEDELGRRLGPAGQFRASQRHAPR